MSSPPQEPVVYLAPHDVLKGRVEPILYMRTCQWLAAAGRRVTLIAPYFYRRENIRLADVFEHFGVPPTFQLSVTPTLLSLKTSSLLWTRVNLLAAFSLRLFPYFLAGRVPIFFSKGQVCMQVVRAFERLTGRQTFKVFELHSLGSNPRLVRMLKDMDLIVANSRLLVSKLEALGIRAERVVQVYNPAFAQPVLIPKDAARQQLRIAADARLLTYSGKVTSGNLRFLVAVANRLKADGFEVHVVGGNPEVLRQAQAAARGADNLRFHGFVPPSALGLYLSATDYLFCSYPDDQANIEQATPAKYFDYMHAGRPVLCSNNTAIREIWKHGENCLMFEPENPDDLREQLLFSQSRPEIRSRMVENNRRLIAGLTWERRIQTILDRLNTLRKDLDAEVGERG